jgi:hypothetical protein
MVWLAVGSRAINSFRRAVRRVEINAVLTADAPSLTPTPPNRCAQTYEDMALRWC